MRNNYRAIIGKITSIGFVATLLLVAILSAIVIDPIMQPDKTKVSAAGGSGTIGTVRVAASADDIRDAGGVFDNTSVSFTLGLTGGTQYSSAARFTGITIPANCTIISAYITLTSKATRSSQVVTWTIRGEDAAAPVAYGAAEDFTLRTYTTASVGWSGTLSWTLDSTYNSPSLLSIVNELYSSYGAYSAGDMAFEIISTTAGDPNYQSVYSYDDTPAKAPLLVITYAPNDCYWVGGTGSWSDATNHWAISSGGAPNANYLPADFTNVYFDANSDTGGVFTVHATSTGYCHDMDWTGVDKVPTFDAVSGPYSLYISGSVTLSSNLLFDSDDGFHIVFTGSGSETITTNGAIFGLEYPYYLEFDGTGDYTLQDNLTTGLTLYFNRGTLNLNDKNVTCAQFEISGTNVRNIDLSDSDITITNANAKWDAGTITNLTFDAGTSDIYLTGANNEFNGGGLTYWKVYLNGSGNQTIKGANTFHELGRTGTSVKTDILTLYANQVVGSGAGILTLNGNSAINRLLVQSDIPATYRTITVNGTISAANVDFIDIQGSGSASWNLSAITGGSGNVGHNAGITFTTAANEYWVDNSGSLSDITHWSSVSGGSGGTGRIPLPQDTAKFDANSINIDSRVVTMDMPRIGNIDMTGVARYPQFDGNGSGGGDIYVYGDVILGDVNWTPANTYFYGRGVQQFWSNGEQVDSTTYLYNYDAIFHIEDDAVFTGTVYLRAGTLNMQGLQLTCNVFNSTTTTYSRSIAWQGGTVYLTYASPQWNVAATNFTIGTNAGNIVFYPTSGSASMTSASFTTYNDIYVEGNTNYTMTFSDSFTCANLIVMRNEAAKTITGNVTITMSGALYSPLSGTTVVTITNTDFSKASGIVSSDYLTLSGSTASGGATFYAGTHSTNGGSNSGWNFTGPTPPSVTTSAVSNADRTSATFNAHVNTMGSWTTANLYYQYNLTGNWSLAYDETDPESVTAQGDYYKDVTGLTPLSHYYIRAVLNFNTYDYAYGSNVEFYTTGQPVVTTGAASSVTSISATLNGTLTTLGEYSTCQVYFKYGLDEFDLDLVTTPETKTSAPAAFFANVLDLKGGYTYYFAAYVNYGSGSTAYGDTESFETMALHKPTTPTIRTTSPVKLNKGKTYVTRLGPTVSSWFDSMGSLVGTDGKGFGGGITFIITAIIVILFSRFGYPVAGFGFALVPAIGSAYIGFWDWEFVGVILFLLALVWVYKTWLEK